MKKLSLIAAIVLRHYHVRVRGRGDRCAGRPRVLHEGQGEHHQAHKGMGETCAQACAKKEAR